MKTLAVAAVIALAAVTIGCSDSHGPTTPLPANVQFDSLAIVNAGSVKWLACFVTNVGQSPAHQVTVCWHFTGDDSARKSPVEPPDLNTAESGLALLTLADNVMWGWPTRPDSILWSETP